MTYRDALDYIREHLTTLNANPNIYEDGTCNVIHALEEKVVPILEEYVMLEEILDKNPHAFDRVNVISAEEIKCILENQNGEV